jgi:hypothetical protein
MLAQTLWSCKPRNSLRAAEPIRRSTDSCGQLLTRVPVTISKRPSRSAARFRPRRRRIAGERQPETGLGGTGQAVDGADVLQCHDARDRQRAASHSDARAALPRMRRASQANGLRDDPAEDRARVGQAGAFFDRAVENDCALGAAKRRAIEAARARFAAAKAKDSWRMIQTRRAVLAQSVPRFSEKHALGPDRWDHAQSRKVPLHRDATQRADRLASQKV